MDVDGDKNYYLLFTAEAAKFDSFVPTVQKMINSFELSTSLLQPAAGIPKNTVVENMTQGNMANGGNLEF